jgi:hypothetical protein
MLGFGGHFLTKARHYSTTFQLLREHRISFRRNEITTGPQQPNTTNQTSEETTLIINNLTYTGTGWHTTGDALLANTAAAQARERQAIGREELAHETATTIPNPMIAAA